MITVQNLVKRFDAHTARKTAVTGISFTVPTGKLFTLLGPSGCGKTTTLRMLAGLERPTEGLITIDERPVYDGERNVLLPANQRPIGMVFQSYAIWPHMSVLQNVAFPLTVGRNRLSAAKARPRAIDMLDLVGLADVADRPATALSGGQQQRVALARALVREPKVLLLDEPLSNLDAQLRERMRDEIRTVQQRLGITAVYVTHDQHEALAISDLIMIMEHGTIVETGEPQQIYRRPNAEFTAHFIGVANSVDGHVQALENNALILMSPLGVLVTPPVADARLGDAVRVFMRPENISLWDRVTGEGAWSGIVQTRIYQGDSWDYTIDVNGHAIRVRVRQEAALRNHGDRVWLKPDGAEAVVMKLHEGVTTPFVLPASHAIANRSS